MTINCQGKILDFDTPKIMGILNCTEDSFYDGGKYTNVQNIVARIDNMLEEGADIIDVGGQSTRPNAKMISANEEWNNIVFALEYLQKNYPQVVVSLDTFWSENIKKGYDMGISIANDVSGGRIDKEYFNTIAELQIPYVLMHSRGSSENMQQLTQYDDVLLEVNYYFSEKIAELRKLGINDIIIDPGIGFAKTVEQNFSLIKNIALLDFNQLPILVGISRKSFIYKTLHTTAEKVMNASSALHLYCLENGAKILRVHDVKEAKECVLLHQKLSIA